MGKQESFYLKSVLFPQSFNQEAPGQVFASSPGFGAEERLWPVEAAGQLVLSYEAGREGGTERVGCGFLFLFRVWGFCMLFGLAE